MACSQMASSSMHRTNERSRRLSSDLRSAAFVPNRRQHRVQRVVVHSPSGTRRGQTDDASFTGENRSRLQESGESSFATVLRDGDTALVTPAGLTKHRLIAVKYSATATKDSRRHVPQTSRCPATVLRPTGATASPGAHIGSHGIVSKRESASRKMAVS